MITSMSSCLHSQSADMDAEVQAHAQNSSESTAVEPRRSNRKRWNVIATETEDTPSEKRLKYAEGFLETRFSGQRADDGAGYGLYARAKNMSEIAFIKGERILNIEGCPAFRVKLDNGLYVEWLFENGVICHLDSKAFTFWSPIEFNLGKQLPPVEYGVKSHDLSLFANDSVRRGAANAHCQFIYEPKIHQSLKPVSFPSGSVPVNLQMTASKPIKDQDEILWHYCSQRADYAPTYAEAFDPAKHSALIRQCTKALLLPDETDQSDTDDVMEIMEDESAFESMRWQDRQLESGHIVSSYPLADLASKLTHEQEKLPWINILRKRLHLLLSKQGFKDTSIISNLEKSSMPNPLKEYRCEWTLADLISLSGYPGNIVRDKASIQDVIVQYSSTRDDSATNTVWALAQLGNVDAILAILIKRGEKRSSLASTSEKFLHRNIKVPIQGLMVVSTVENLKQFVSERLPAQQKLRIIGIADLSDDEVKAKVSGSSGAAIYTKQVKKKMSQCENQSEQLALFKTFLRFFGTSSDHIHKSSFMRSAKEMATLISFYKEPLTEGDIVSLFKDDAGDQEWLQIILPYIKLTDEQLLTKLEAAEKWNKTPRQILIKRGLNNIELWGRILVADYKNCQGTERRYFSRMVEVFTAAGYPPPVGNKWRSEDLRKLYDGAQSLSKTASSMCLQNKSVDDWIQIITTDKNKARSFGAEYHRRIKSADLNDAKTDLIREFIEICCKTLKVDCPSELIARLAGIDIPDLKKPYCIHDIIHLFDVSLPENAWLTQTFPVQTQSDDDLLLSLSLEPAIKIKQAWVEAWSRGRKNLVFRQSMLAILQQGTSSEKQFYERMLKKFIQYGYSQPDSGYWSIENVKAAHQAATEVQTPILHSTA